MTWTPIDIIITIFFIALVLFILFKIVALLYEVWSSFREELEEDITPSSKKDYYTLHLDIGGFKQYINIEKFNYQSPFKLPLKVENTDLIKFLHKIDDCPEPSKYINFRLIEVNENTKNAFYKYEGVE